MSDLRFGCRHRFSSGFELDARFEADSGVTALFGPSGAGKSTCLSVIAGVLRPQAGRVTLGETVLLDVGQNIFLPPEDRQVGVIFQEHRLFPHLTVAENLRFGQRRQKKSPIHFDKLIEILELGELLDRYPRRLSGGQQQRVALGRGILRSPAMLLMDEPLTALDQVLKERILVYLERALAQWQIPTLFVSHDQADVRRLAQRVVVLEAGKVVDAGPAITTLDAAVTTKMRSRPGPLNLVRVNEVRQIDGHWEGQVGQHPIRLPMAVGAVKPPIYVQFLPSDVTLSRTHVEGLSVRNQLPGRVRELVSFADRLFVAVEVGVLLWAEITPDSARELDLVMDAAVTCLIKTTAVKLAD
jgi:molybdate transport system ATP-binding protein